MFWIFLNLSISESNLWRFKKSEQNKNIEFWTNHVYSALRFILSIFFLKDPFATTEMPRLMYSCYGIISIRAVMQHIIISFNNWQQRNCVVFCVHLLLVCTSNWREVGCRFPSRFLKNMKQKFFNLSGTRAAKQRPISA